VPIRGKVFRFTLKNAVGAAVGANDRKLETSLRSFSFALATASQPKFSALTACFVENIPICVVTSACYTCRKLSNRCKNDAKAPE
jgi:hypothetical protein